MVRQVLGRGLKDLPRDQIVVATKVGRYGQDVFDFSAARVKATLDPYSNPTPIATPLQTLPPEVACGGGHMLRSTCKIAHCRHPCVHS